MTAHHSARLAHQLDCKLDRRALITRTAAMAAFAGLLHGTTLSVTAQASPEAGDDPFANLVAANTTFALDLYHQLRQEAEGNLLFSPYSISLALAMTYAGARGDTATQMADTLGFDLPDVDIHASLGALTDALLERGNPTESVSGLRIANALWGEQTFPFYAAFTAQLEEAYGAGLQQTDFINASGAARDEINAWVEEHTEDRIQDIVPEGAITSLTRLVLANAIYFYGAWRNTFEKVNTEDDSFHLADGSTIDVPFISQREHLRYARADGMQLVELPYDTDGFAMTVILPDEGAFDTAEGDLDMETLGTAIDALEYTDVRLWFPKFRFEYAASLAGTLQALGLTDAFDPDLADFTGMIDVPAGEDPQENLAITDILHKAFIAVDEDGTEAAAATVVIVGTTSAAPEPEEPIELRVDRPFLFAIRDTETGTILFLGRVLDPRG